MFYEDVPFTDEIGRTPAHIFAQYGIDERAFATILNLPQNEFLRRSTKAPIRLDTYFPSGSASIRLPIDISVPSDKRKFKPRVDMKDGLRPALVQNGVVRRSPYTHGVDVLLERSGTPCKRIRWLQTVTKRNDPDPTQPPEFVDGGGNNLPWYHNDVRAPAPLEFDDTPCGRAVSPKQKGLEFFATVSVAVWTIDRITLVSSFRYGFSIMPGNDDRSIRLNPHLRPATGDEIAEQVRILTKVGVSQFRRPTGPDLRYVPPPPPDSVNQGPLFRQQGR